MTERTEMYRRTQQDVANHCGIPRTTHDQRQHRTSSPWARRAGRNVFYEKHRLRAWFTPLDDGSAGMVSRADHYPEPSV